MRTSTASLSKKLISTFFAATLALGLVPAAAFAVDDDGLQSIPEGSEGAVPVASNAEEEGRDVLALPSDVDPSVDGDGADSTSEDVTDTNMESEQDGSAASDGFQDDAAASDGTQEAVLAAGVINQTMPLEVVAQQESTRSYFLAQTLESTKTVPIVSASLPLDTSTNQGPQAGADGGTTVGSEDEVTDGDPSVSAEGESGSEPEEGDDPDESDPGASDGASVVTPGVSSESTVVGSFTYLGMTFAVEPGGESVALVAVDYNKLPEEFVQKQILVLPDAATPDGMDYYSVTRIATDAFSSLTKDGANPDHAGCIELFSDEELLAEAGIDPTEVAGFMPQDDAATAAEDGQDADESSDDIRTIVSMDGNVATLDDGSTYTFTNPLEGCAGILALGIPASMTSIEDDAFAGADTLQYLVVSEDNPEYASFDGALYSADMTNLRLIPEGRVGAVRVASSATSVDPEVFSHCPSVDALVADAESEIWPFLKTKSNELEGKDGAAIRLLSSRTAVSIDDGVLSDILQKAGERSEGMNDSGTASFLGRSGYEADIVTRTFTTLSLHAREPVYIQWNAVKTSFGTPNGGGSYLRLSGDTLNDRAVLVDTQWDHLKKVGAVGFTDPLTHGTAGARFFTNSAFDFQVASRPGYTGPTGGVTKLHFQNRAAYQDKTAKELTQYSGPQVIPETGLTEVWINGYTSYMELSEEYLPNGGAWATVDNHAINNTDSKLFEHANTSYGYAIRRDVTVRPAPESAPSNKPIFAGWRCINDGKTYKPGDKIANTGELLRFEAQWSSSFTLKWDKNTEDVSVGGMPEERSIAATASGTSAVNATGLKSLYSSVAALPATPVRTGYAFAGWYLDARHQQRVTAAVLSRKIASSNYAGSDAASCIKAASDGSITLYAGWAKPYDNLKVYADKTVYVSWNSEVSSFEARAGADYRILGNSFDPAKQYPYFFQVVTALGSGRVRVSVNGLPAYPGQGASNCYFAEVEGKLPDATNGGISKAFLQDSNALRSKTVVQLGSAQTYQLSADSKARLWLNDYKYQMWLSEEYLPNGGTWATVDANATAPDDSKYYEHAGRTYDGTTSTTVTVKAAPDNVPADKPVFTGWKCLDDGKVYLPGDVIANVKRPLRFEAQWSESFSLKWDANGHDVWPSGIASDDVSSMPSDATVAAYGVGSAAINVRGLKSLYPSEAELPSTPVREGRLFAGWYLDAACTARVTDAILSRAIVSSNYSGSDEADCLKAASDGSITLYAGWALPYRNLTVFSDEGLYVSWNANVAAMDATDGAPYRIMGNTIDPDAEPIVYDLGMSGTRLSVRAPSAWKGQAGPGASLCYTNADPLTGAAAPDSGVRSVLLQDSRAYRDKTVHALVRTELAPDSEAKAWINDYRYSMWLSEEYLPNGGTWVAVDANATSADDSKYYEYEGRTYDGTTSVTVTVREAPENAPEDKPVFLGWRCRLMDGTYMDGLLQPGDEIEGVSEPLVFEAVWTDIYNVAVPLLVGVALDPATGEARASEGASLSTTNPSQVKVVSLEYDLVEETDDLDGKGEASVPGGGTHRVFSDEEGASHLDEVSLTVLAGEAAGGESADAVPLVVPLSAPSRLDDADALVAAGFVPFGADAGDLQLEYGLRFSLEGDDLTDMLGRLGLPEKDGLDGTSSESFPIAKLFYTIAMVERGD